MNPLNPTYQLFIDEAPELLRQIEAGLLNIQEDRSTSKIHEIMRATHSIKGAAATVGLQGIKNIAHQLEDYVKALYDENLVIDTELENLFLEAYDSLAIPLVQQLETGDFDRQEAQTRTEQIKEKLEVKLATSLAKMESYLPSSEDLGIDMIASLFEVDVAQEIRRLKGLVASPDSFNAEEELQESLQVLQGISEIVDLSGFSILIAITQQALENHPDKTLAIASLLLQDLEISRNLVLNGDRDQGGNPCSTLLNLAEDLDATLDHSTIHKIIKTHKTTVTVNDPTYQLFIAEVPDLLYSLENALLSIKEDKSVNNINDIMRAAHSIKGGAASVALEEIKQMSHRLEDYVKALFDETVVVDDELETDFLSAFDCLKNALTEQINTGRHSSQWQEQAEAIWQKLEQKLGHIDKSDYLPSSTDLGVDMVSSIFEVDVNNSIAELEKTLVTSGNEELFANVSQQLDVLAGFAEVTNLSGLKEITTVARQALTQNPEELKTITSLLINDLTQAREAVLNGDRTEGGKPSMQLRALAQADAEEMSMDFVELIEEDDLKKEQLIYQEIENIDRGTVDFTNLVTELNTWEENNQLSESDIFEFSEDFISGIEITEASAVNNDTQYTENLVDLPESYLFNDNLVSEQEENIFAEYQSEIPAVDTSMQEELQAQSYQFFLEEAVDLIALIDDNLENVLANRDLNEINEVARCAHSLKGGSRSAGLEDLGMISLRVEKSLKALFNEAIPLNESLKSYLRDIYQILRQAVVARIENQEFDESAALVEVNEMWSAFEEQYGEEIAKSEEYLPSSSDLGVDITQSMFEVDVQEAIEDLRSKLAAGNEDELSETLTMQIEVLSGFGEMLTLPGFSSICDTARRALAHNPASLPAITQALIASLEIAREQVLAGDRSLGGEPSYELLVLAGEAQETSAPEAPIDTNNQAYGFFVEEVPELLQSLENGLLTLDEDRSTAKIHEIMRAAHSIKGGAASVGLDAIKTVAHRLEDIFKALYAPEIEIDTELENWLLEGFDCLRNALTNQIETGTYDAPATLAQAQEVMSKIEAKLGPALERADNYIPSSSDLGVDIVQSMFEVDVLEELERLKRVSSGSQTQLLMGELRATLDVFAGFGEMLNLSGFHEIAQLGLKAIEINPQQVSTIIQVIIHDVEQARDLVLEGDRTTGGNPSNQLINLAQTSISEVGKEEQQQTLTNAPPLEEVFQMDLDEMARADLESDEAIADLEEIFAADLSREEINLLTQTSELALENDKNNTIPSLDEIFALPDLEELKSQVEEDDDAEDIDAPSVEDVFGAIEAGTFGQSATLVQEEVQSHQTQSEESTSEQSAEVGASGDTSTQNSSDQPQNIKEAIASIEELYSQLPGLKTAGELKNKVKQEPSVNRNLAPRQAQTPKPVSSGPIKSNLSIRVDLDRLERMNNLIGELSINRNGLSLQNDRLQDSVQELTDRFANFQQMANNLRDLSDKMLVSPEKFTPQNAPVVKNDLNKSFALSQEDEFDLGSAFDALEMDRYDNLYNVVQGLIEQMIQLEEAVEDISLFAGQSGQTVENQRQMLNRLRDELMWARMLPLGEILNRFPRVLRDLSVKYNKKVNLKLDGTNVLVDKAALEKLYDPLVHLIRNAFDHGIETPEVRKQKGKAIMGTIQVKAYHQGNQTIIEIRDDGAGLNIDRIKEKAIERKLITPDEATEINRENLLDLIFEPGFSTAASVTEISGRGVGLDIVRSQLRPLKGSISVDTKVNVGTTFTMRLPLTLTIDKLLVLSAGEHFYALPSDNINEIIVPEAQQIKTSANQRFLHYENYVIPIYALTDLLPYSCHIAQYTAKNQALQILPSPDEWGNPLLVLNLGKELFAIEVEHLVSEQELVIKPFGKALSAPNYTYGCTVLGDGTLIPVVNTATLLANYFQTSQSSLQLSASTSDTTSQESIPAAANTNIFQVASVLVVDDSAAMRRTLALSLEKAGYRVIQAKDGKEALEQLQKISNINLIICDIEMPNMNGFEFLGQRRRYPDLNKIPVAMLTSRSNDKHRKLATHLGANAYFTKPYIEQKFLQSIHNLIENKSLATV